MYVHSKTSHMGPENGYSETLQMGFGFLTG